MEGANETGGTLGDTTQADLNSPTRGAPARRRRAARGPENLAAHPAPKCADQGGAPGSATPARAKAQQRDRACGPAASGTVRPQAASRRCAFGAAPRGQGREFQVYSKMLG
jgi:hypothetical protein